MIIIETKTSVHIFRDSDINLVDYNMELNKATASVMDELGVWEKKTFDDVLNVRYMTDACPKPYDFKSSEQTRILRELEERRNLDSINNYLVRTLCAACESLQKGDGKAEQYEKDIDKMFEERREFYNRIYAIREMEEKEDK